MHFWYKRTIFFEGITSKCKRNSATLYNGCFSSSVWSLILHYHHPLGLQHCGSHNGWPISTPSTKKGLCVYLRWLIVDVLCCLFFHTLDNKLHQILFIARTLWEYQQYLSCVQHWARYVWALWSGRLGKHCIHEIESDYCNNSSNLMLMDNRTSDHTWNKSTLCGIIYSSFCIWMVWIRVITQHLRLMSIDRYSTA